MCLFVSLLLCAMLVLAVAGTAAVSAPPGPAEYRVEVEQAPGPSADAVEFRIRVRTAGERPVYLDLDGGQITQPLPAHPEDGGGVWRADLVIRVALRASSGGTDLECRLERAGGGGITFTDAVAAGSTVEGSVEVAAGAFTRRSGEKHVVARVSGKAVEVWAA